MASWQTISEHMTPEEKTDCMAWLEARAEHQQKYVDKMPEQYRHRHTNWYSRIWHLIHHSPRAQMDYEDVGHLVFAIGHHFAYIHHDCFRGAGVNWPRNKEDLAVLKRSWDLQYKILEASL